jgi:glutamate carboxypeptidase
MPLTTLEREIADAAEARRDELFQDLKLHVETPTGGNHAPGLDQTRSILLERLARLGGVPTLIPGDPKPGWLLGATGGVIPPTGIASRPSKEAGLTRILIAGHMDTVHDPAGPFQKLTVNPDGKTAIGPGCVDMKGGLVIAVAALEILHELRVDCAWSFLLNSDEETGSYYSESAIRQAAREHDLALALEPSLPDGSLVIERAGSGQFKVETFGKSAHVGRDFTSGISAVTELARVLLELAKLPEPERGMIVNVGPLKGGDVTNGVPDYAQAWGNVRFPNPEGCEELAAKVDALMTPADAPKDRLPRVVIHRSFNRPAKPLTPGVQFLADSAKAVATELGQPMPFGRTAGVCDGNILQDEGLPCIDTLGVRGGGLHTPDEWIDLSSLVERCQLLAILMARLSHADRARLGRGG